MLIIQCVSLLKSNKLFLLIRQHTSHSSQTKQDVSYYWFPLSTAVVLIYIIHNNAENANSHMQLCDTLEYAFLIQKVLSPTFNPMAAGIQHTFNYLEISFFPLILSSKLQ